MEPTSRNPVYHERFSYLRVVSKPNGRWQAQRLASKSTKGFDGWDGIHPPSDYATAKARMDRSE